MLVIREIRIMKKVLLGGAHGITNVESVDCVAALDMTDWDVHKAIKFVRLGHQIWAFL